MLVEDAPSDVVIGPRTLAIDIGGSHLKAGLLGASGVLVGAPVRIATPSPATPAAVLGTLLEALGTLGAADRVSAGFPGVVRGGVVLTAPNLGTAAWHAFPLAAELGKRLGQPTRVLNDAVVQGLGVIAGQGLECVLTLGTGMGFALFQHGKLTPHLEMSQHTVRGNKTYDQYIGNAARLEVGNKRWNRRMVRVITELRRVINFDVLLVGGGNAKLLQIDLPADMRIVSNQAGMTGGIKLWDPALDGFFADGM